MLADAPAAVSEDTAEALTPDAPDLAPDTGEESGTDAPAGQPRDAATGRWASPASAPAGTDVQAPGETGNAAAPPGASPDDAAPASSAVPPAPDPAAAASGQPFVFRAAGREHPLEGATLTADGTLTVAPAALPRVQQLLAAGREYETHGQQQLQQLRREAVEARTQFSEREARAEAMVATIEQLLEAGPDAIAALLDDYDRNRPLLQAEIERETARRELAAAQRLREPSPEQAAAQRTQQLAETVASYAQAARHEFPEAQALTDAEAGQLEQDLIATYGDWLVRPATATEAAEHGVPAGAPVFDADRFAMLYQREAQRRVAPRQAADAARREAAERAKAQQAAARANARQAAPAPAPPVAATGAASGAVTPAAGAGARTEFASKAEWRRAMGR